MNYKLCTKCQIEKPASRDFFISEVRSETGIGNTCRDCRNAYLREHRQKPGIREKVIKSKRDYRERGGEALRAKEKRRHKASVDGLRDCYVIDCIVDQRPNISRDEIPKSMIETKRLLIKLKRQINTR